MKSCPSCNLKYADDTLQFCLNDGTQLVEFFDETEPATVFTSAPTQTAEKSHFAHTNFQTIATGQITSAGLPETGQSTVENSTYQTAIATNTAAADNLFFKILAFAPIVVALMQNYWQWLYMAKYDAFKFPAFVWELNFWVWLFLLLSGIALCTLAIKNNKNRGFAIVGLVVLAINFLLCLAPRR